MNQTEDKCTETGQGRARQGKAGRGRTRQDKRRQGKARQSKTRQSKARQGKARQSETRQGKTGQDRARQVSEDVLVTDACIVKRFALSPTLLSETTEMTRRILKCVSPANVRCKSVLEYGTERRVQCPPSIQTGDWLSEDTSACLVIRMIGMVYLPGFLMTRLRIPPVHPPSATEGAARET
ncbi:hypothetical protein E2C01_048577 [Portunus trituberculatus]|uniref:Uncharacterized protein n=1 Tax=Portunus trituberculatus TaxID=210409 RepID=A0A5B7GDT1_PORTR|nr:hypothetical protein [Portunus trituberculatus]